MCVGQVKSDNGVLYHKTKHGWIVTGEIHVQSTKSITCLSLESLNFNLRKFWQMDEFISNRPFLTPDEKVCEKLFETTTERAPDGKFIVRMPT